MFSLVRCPICDKSKKVRTFDEATFYCLACEIKFFKDKEGTISMEFKRMDNGKSDEKWRKTLTI